jgi:hypothetical protein
MKQSVRLMRAQQFAKKCGFPAPGSVMYGYVRGGWGHGMEILTADRSIWFVHPVNGIKDRGRKWTAQSDVYIAELRERRNP